MEAKRKNIHHVNNPIERLVAYKMKAGLKGRRVNVLATIRLDHYAGYKYVGSNEPTCETLPHEPSLTLLWVEPLLEGELLLTTKEQERQLERILQRTLKRNRLVFLPKDPRGSTGFALNPDREVPLKLVRLENLLAA